MLIEGYTRKSRALGDPEDPALLATHVDLIRRMAAEDGVALPDDAIYTEVGSGETIRERPTFAGRLAYWESLPPDTCGFLYVTELSRLSRGRMSERGRIFDALYDADVKVRTPTRTWDFRNPDDEEFYESRSSRDRAELRFFKERCRWKWEQLLREGKSRNGRVCFGYLWNRKERRIEPDPDRFEVLKAMLRDAFELSLNQLAERYGLPRHVVQGTLSSPVVCGWLPRVCAPHRGKKRRQVDGKPWEKQYLRLAVEQWTWPEQPGDYEAAISREEFLRLQTVRRSRSKGQAVAYAPHGWCRDVLRFEGQPENVPTRLGSWSNGRGRHWSTYEAPTPAPPLLYIRRDMVHETVTAALAAVWSEPARVQAAVAAFRQSDADRRQALLAAPERRDRQRWEEEVARLRTQLDELILAEVGAAGERRASFARLAEQTERQIEEVRARLRLPFPEPEEDHSMEQQLAQVEQIIRDEFWLLWEDEECTDQDRRFLVKLSFSRVLARVAPGANHRRYTREVVAIEPRPWMPVSC